MPRLSSLTARHPTETWPHNVNRDRNGYSRRITRLRVGTVRRSRVAQAPHSDGRASVKPLAGTCPHSSWHLGPHDSTRNTPIAGAAINIASCQGFRLGCGRLSNSGPAAHGHWK